ncbi:MAG: hypothetical protein AAGD06_32430, partial [Acidobacteriota bacterium]
MNHPRTTPVYTALALLVFGMIWCGVYIYCLPISASQTETWSDILLPPSYWNEMATEVCTLILVDGGTVAPETASEILHLYNRRRRGLVGDSVQLVDKLDLDEEVASAHFPPRIFKGMGDTKTYLAGVFDAVEAAEPRWLSVWLYTD